MRNKEGGAKKPVFDSRLWRITQNLTNPVGKKNIIYRKSNRPYPSKSYAADPYKTVGLDQTRIGRRISLIGHQVIYFCIIYFE